MNPKDTVGAKKAPLTLVPPSAIIAMAEAMGNGADKYGPFNWRDQPVQVRTYIEAALRHLFAFLDGQWAAEDTGISHLAHAMAGLAILNDAFSIGAVVDNRSTGAAADLLRAQDKSVNPGDLKVGSVENVTVTYMGVDLAAGQDDTVFVVFSDDPSMLAGLTCEWGSTGVHDPWCRTERSPEWDSVLPAMFKADNRGELGSDFEVQRGPGGWYPCCGATEHVLQCPYYDGD
jgi:hypothetical protein